MSKPRYLLVTESGDVEKTANDVIFSAAKSDGSTLVIDLVEMRYYFDGEEQSILEAEEDDWMREDADDGEDE